MLELLFITQQNLIKVQESSKILIENNANVNMPDKEMWIPLHLAAWKNPNLRVVKIFIRNGADMTAMNDLGYIPYYYSKFNKQNPEISKYIYDQQALRIFYMRDRHVSF